MTDFVTLFAFSGLINGIFALSFGLVVIFKNWRSRDNQLFFAMTAAIVLWTFFYWRWLSADRYEMALAWVRLSSVGSIFIPVFYFHWIVIFLNKREWFKVLLRFVYALALGLLFFASSPLFIKEVSPQISFPFWPEPGILYSLYVLFIYIGLVLTSLILLFSEYKRTARDRRGQIFYIILGTLFGFLGGATNFFLWYHVPVPPYGNFISALFPFFLGYAVLKHKLFDLKVVATELLVFSIWLFLLVRALLASDKIERFLDLGLLTLVVFFGIFLIRSVLREVESRGKIESLAKELAAANEELKKLDEAKSEFISLAGHQLRAPLTVIRGYISLLLEGRFGAITEQAADGMKKVSVSAEELVKLVSDLLDLSRIEAGRMKYDFQPILLDDVASEVVRELEVNAKTKGIGLSFVSRNAAKIAVSADPDKFREIVMNLVDNAIKYTAAGGVTAELYPETNQGRDWLVLKVSDTGIGIKPSDIPTLFAKFARTEEAKRVRADGLGLGLYFVKRIVDDHGGRIWVESPGAGQGSAFFVALPSAA